MRLREMRAFFCFVITIQKNAKLRSEDRVLNRYVFLPGKERKGNGD